MSYNATTVCEWTEFIAGVQYPPHMGHFLVTVNNGGKPQSGYAYWAGRWRTANKQALLKLPVIAFAPQPAPYQPAVPLKSYPETPEQIVGTDPWEKPLSGAEAAKTKKYW